MNKQLRMPRWWIDQVIGQTPCLCGDIETWHPRCFTGKSDEEIEKAYTQAYRKVRKILLKEIDEQAKKVIEEAQK